MKKILLSLLSIAAVGVVAFGATTAFFTDVETSTGNTFAAGSIDLKIDNTSYLNGVLQTRLSWGLTNLVNELFFNYSDLKPGDEGEDTVSLHVYDNDAWACVDIKITANDDVTCTEPELGDDPTCGALDPDLSDGELASELTFLFWVDDGDNVFETDEDILTGGPADAVLGGVTWTLADSQENNVGGADGTPLTGSQDYFIGKAWCYGTLTPTPLPPDRGTPGVPEDDDNTPAEGLSGVSCDGSGVNNASQTDVLIGDISFYAEQHRNNPSFQCGD